MEGRETRGLETNSHEHRNTRRRSHPPPLRALIEPGFVRRIQNERAGRQLAHAQAAGAVAAQIGGESPPFRPPKPSRGLRAARRSFSAAPG